MDAQGQPLSFHSEFKENPAAIKAFLSAFTKGAKEVMANPDAAIEYVKQRDGIINTDMEKRRLRMAIEKAKASKPSIILVDAVMPGKTGYDLCQAVKADAVLVTPTRPGALLTAARERRLA